MNASLVAALVCGGIIFNISWLVGLPTDWRTASVVVLSYAAGRIVVPLFDRPSS